jgi:hypothetical protein
MKKAAAKRKQRESCYTATKSRPNPNRKPSYHGEGFHFCAHLGSQQASEILQLHGESSRAALKNVLIGCSDNSGTTEPTGCCATFDFRFWFPDLFLGRRKMGSQPESVSRMDLVTSRPAVLTKKITIVARI